MSIPLRPQTAPESVKADELHEVVSNEVSCREEKFRAPAPRLKNVLVVRFFPHLLDISTPPLCSFHPSLYNTTATAPAPALDNQ